MLERDHRAAGPAVTLPYAPILLAAYVNEALFGLTGREPLIPLAGVQMAKKFMYFDPAKAVARTGPSPDARSAKRSGAGRRLVPQPRLRSVSDDKGRTVKAI